MPWTQGTRIRLHALGEGEREMPVCLENRTGYLTENRLKKMRKCLGCGNQFDSNGPGNRFCGPCKTRRRRPPTIIDYGENRSTTAARSTGKPTKWR